MAERDPETLRQEKEARMIKEPVERLVCRLAGPSIATMLISALYNMADTYFVGRIGTSATAAVGVAFSVMAVIQAMGFFFGHGSGNYISRELGAGNREEAERMAATGFLSSILAGICLGGVGLLFIRPCARLLGATDTILPYAVSYLRFIFIGAPWMAGSLTLNNLLRFQGSSFYGMVGMVSGAILNIVLDPVFIFTLNLGVAGAALATMLSQLAGCVFLFYGCARGGNIPIRLRSFSPSLSRYREMLRGGTPSLFRQGLGSVSLMVMNNMAGSFGDAAIAAISIASRVSQFAFSALIGFGQGFQPVCGFNYGAKQYGRVTRAFRFCLRVSTVAMASIAVIGIAFAPGIITLFRADDPDVLRIGTLSLRIIFATFPLMGWYSLCSMMTQTMGLAAKASLIAIARQGLFLIPTLLLLTPTLGLLGVQLAQPVSDTLAFLLSLPIGLGVLRDLRRADQEQS